MNITVIGAGNAGSTVAADLTLRGHRVSLLKTSDKMHGDHFAALLRNKTVTVEENGTEKTAVLHLVTTSPEEALPPDTELIIIYVQTNYHERIIERIEPYLRDGQIVLFEPGYLSTAYLLKHSRKDLISVEAESSPVDCRILSPGYCSVVFRNVRNPIAVYPSEKTDEILTRLLPLGYPFCPLRSVVEAALHNPNLIVHTVGAVMSIPRIEYSKGDYWMYREVFTPKVWNMVETLDAEKTAVLSSLGLPPLSYVNACRNRNFENEEEIDAKAAFYEYANHHSPKGPSIPDSRYVTEDVSQGLCLLESLGATLGVATPVASALITLASALLGQDFRAEGRTQKRLGRESLDRIFSELK